MYILIKHLKFKPNKTCVYIYQKSIIKHVVCITEHSKANDCIIDL